MNYGDGFDTLSLQPRGTAVTFIGAPSAMADGLGQVINFSLQRVNTMEDFQVALDVKVDVSASFGLFGASANFEFAKSQHFHSYSEYVIAKVTVENPLLQIQDPNIKVKPDAATLIESGKVNEFHNDFGDFFVKGVQTGGAYYGVMEFTSNSQEEHDSIKASLDVGEFGLFSASTKFSEAIKHLQGMSGLQVFNY